MCFTSQVQAMCFTIPTATESGPARGNLSSTHTLTAAPTYAATTALSPTPRHAQRTHHLPTHGHHYNSGVRHIRCRHLHHTEPNQRLQRHHPHKSSALTPPPSTTTANPFGLLQDLGDNDAIDSTTPSTVTSVIPQAHRQAQGSTCRPGPPP
jgi:hypothetical protein